jgi:CDP-diacylglycerol---serine O-phosphatidyltransferase
MSLDARLRRPALSRRLRRGAYLLPSLFTIFNVLLGFYAVICGLQGDFERAALLVFVAAITDSLDGRIARMTGTETEFGKEFDSLADVITFGIAPALLAYLWGVKDLAPRAWLVPLFYVVTTASRLARFNVQQSKADSRFFVGLPAPAAAVAICSLLFFAPDPAWRDWVTGAMVVSLLLIGALMVSTFRYYSFKKLDLRRRWSYRVALPLAAIVGALVYALTSSQLLPQAAFMVLALVYTLSGPATYVWNRLLRRRHGKPSATPELPAATGPLPGRRPLIARTAPPAPGGPPATPAAPPGARGAPGTTAAAPLPATATPLLPLPDRPAPELPPAEHAALPDKGVPADKKKPPDKKAAPDRKSPP